MKTIKIKLYKLNELEDKAKEKAIENLRDINIDGDWYEYIEMDFKQHLETLGYENIKMYFSGFWSQGDGACFTASIDVEKYIKAHKLEAEFSKLLEFENYGTINISHNQRYYYSTSTTVESDGFYLEGDEVGSQADKLVEYIEKEREELGNKLYKELEETYNNLTSDEAVAETLEANEYDFLENGERSMF